MRLSIDRSHVKVVERSIDPGLAYAITLPVRIAAQPDCDVVVYVGIPYVAWACCETPGAQEELLRALAEVARRLELKPLNKAVRA